MKKRIVASTVLLLAGCSTARLATSMGGLPSGKQIDHVTPGPFQNGKKAIGKDADVRLYSLQGAGLMPSSPLSAYLDRLVTKLAAASPISAAPLNTYVVASFDWSAVTSADANVYITLGALRDAKSEDEIAALLGHEISHALLAHADSDTVADTQKTLIDLTGKALYAKAQFDAVDSGKRATSMGDTTPLGKQELLLMANTTFAAPAWNRVQESEADLLGVDLLAKTGHNPAAMRTVLEKVRQIEAAKPIAPPSPPDSNQDQQPTRSGWGTADKAAAMWNVTQKLMPSAADSVQSTHPDTAERIRNVDAYLAREYSGAAAGTGATDDPWLRLRQSKDVAVLFEHYDYAARALALLEEGNEAKAQDLATLGARGATARHAYPVYALAAVYTARSKADKALQTLSPLLSGDGTSWLALNLASEIQRRRGNVKEAVALSERGFAHFGEPALLMPEMVETYLQAGQTAKATAMRQRCQADPGVAKYCSTTSTAAKK